MLMVMSMAAVLMDMLRLNDGGPLLPFPGELIESVLGKQSVATVCGNLDAEGRGVFAENQLVNVLTGDNKTTGPGRDRHPLENVSGFFFSNHQGVMNRAGMLMGMPVIMIVFVVVFNSLVTLWFLLGQEGLLAGALKTFRRRASVGSVACLVVCVALVVEPFAAAIVASAYPGTLSLATFLKLQTGMGACLGLLSKCMGVFEKIRARADEYERRARERKERQQQRKTRFASI